MGKNDRNARLTTSSNPDEKGEFPKKPQERNRRGFQRKEGWEKTGFCGYREEVRTVISLKGVPCKRGRGNWLGMTGEEKEEVKDWVHEGKTQCSAAKKIKKMENLSFHTFEGKGRESEKGGKRDDAFVDVGKGRAWGNTKKRVNRGGFFGRNNKKEMGE